MTTPSSSPPAALLMQARADIDRYDELAAEHAALQEELDRQRGNWQTLLPDPLAHKAISQIDATLAPTNK